MTTSAQPESPAVLSRAIAAAEQWEAKAKERRQLSAHDPVADTLEFCSRELRLSLDNVALEEISTAEYAQMHGKNEVTVRRWCLRGLIGRKVGGEYRIRRGEPVPTFGRKSA